jgi:peptidoglycan/LPS O-acetylase OafA/YrhL
MPRQSDKASRDNNFNLLRMIAASAVLISHAYPISLGMRAVEPLSDILSMSLGWLAVVTFFAISGFFISQSFETRSSFLEFSLARILRIYPGLLAVLLLTVLVIGPAFTTLPERAYLSQAHTISYVPHNLSLKWLQYDLPDVFTANPYPRAINGSLWTLFYEVVCYGMVVLVGLLGVTRRALTFLMFGAAYLLVHFGSYWLAPLRNFTVEHGAFESLNQLSYPFVLGMAVYHFRRLILPRLALLSLACTAALALLYWRGLFFRDAFILFWTVLIFYLGYLPLRPLKLYNRLGDYSYGMYIYAFPFEQIGAALWTSISPLQLILFSFPATLAFAIMSWHLIERRALSYRTKLTAWLLSRFKKQRAEPADLSA